MRLGDIMSVNQIGIIFSPEIKTLAWFRATIVGLALFSGKFLHWQYVDQAVGVAVLCGVAFLLVRTGG